MINLEAAGLSLTEAKTYQTLLTKPDWAPRDIANTVGETRTNMYKVLDQLTEMGLAEKFDKAKKFHYRAMNPARLIELADKIKASQRQAEKQLQLDVQNLTENFVKTSEQPGIRFFQGKEEIKAVFEEIAGSSEEVVFVHTIAGMDFYGFKGMHNLRMLAPKAGVKRRALTPDSPKSTKDFRIKDPMVLLKRTWFEKNDYTAPVEWGAFDDKLYIISYGQEATATIIENSQIADAFKQLFTLLERGQRSQAWYKQLPRLASATGETSTSLT